MSEVSVLTRTFTLRGLNCPACAAKIESDCTGISYVRRAVISVFEQKLHLELEEGSDPDTCTGDVRRIVANYEPEVEVLPEEKKVVHFRLAGLNCENCAHKIEKALQEMPWVEEAQVNLLCQTLSLSLRQNAADGIDAAKLLQQVREVVERYERGVSVSLSEKLGQKSLVGPEGGWSNETEGRTLIFISILFAIALVLHFALTLPLSIDLGIFVLIYFLAGHGVLRLAFQHMFTGNIFDENFLMSISTLGAFCIQEYPEACAVMLFYRIGEYLQKRAVRISKRSIESLMEIRPDSACVLRQGKELNVDASEVEVGEQIYVRPGERIPLDGRVLEGSSHLDTSALTGESLPREVGVGSEILSGCINMSGLLKIEVSSAFADSTVSRMLNLVEKAAARKARTENFITSFARWYTPLVVGLALCLALIPPLFFGTEWEDWIRRGFVFLIVSCPCALVLSIPLTFFGGIGACSRQGILVKGSNYLEALSALDTCVFDKTGTLTRGIFAIQNVLPANGVSRDELLFACAVAEKRSTHPVARAICEDFAGKIPDATDCQEEAGFGISVLWQGHRIRVGRKDYLTKAGIETFECTLPGTKVWVARDTMVLGVIVVADSVRESSRTAIENLRALGVRRCIMLTGDDPVIAKCISDELALDTYRAGLLPAEKVRELEILEAELPAGKKLAYAGDGINDAPVLARADVGIAMGGFGSDAAIEASDVVLMIDEPDRLVRAVEIARQTKAIALQNIVLALGIKCIFLLLGAFGLIGLWEAVFGDVGVTLICVMNSLRILSRKYSAMSIKASLKK